MGRGGRGEGRQLRQRSQGDPRAGRVGQGGGRRRGGGGEAGKLEVILQLVVDHVVHGTLHLRQHPLLLTLWYAAETHRISAHAHGEALLKATLLAPIPVAPDDGAALVLQTLLVPDVLLDAAAEEALTSFTCMDSIVEA